MGLAPPAPIPEAAHFQKWLGEGRHGEMRYMAARPERRVDPSLVYADVRSIVSAGMSHASDHDGAAAGGSPAAPRGRVARYARGADYHNVLGRKLRRLMKRWRTEVPGLDGRWYVDTGPVMDRAWAARSGVGWWGKHTNLVSREHGSWLLLGTVLLNRELDYDPPHRDFCGTCRRCIDACPTGAITGERELDSRLCISYLTIEHRGPIPPDLRPLMGDWIFGCDLCLDVCPWNRFARESREARFQARADLASPELIPLLSLTEADFRARFNGSPVQRARREGFVRNVAVALGNTGGPESLEPLRRAAESDPSELVREHARWAVGRILERLGKAPASARRCG